MASAADIQSIVDYFGSSSSIYKKIVFGTATDAEISYALSQIPQMKIDVSAAGSTLGYSYADPVYIVPSQTDDIISGINSNAGSASYGGGGSANYPISFGRDAETGQAFISSGKNAVGDTLKAVADRVSLGITGVNIGCKLGKAIDQTLYNLNPDWWDENYPSINPNTWPSLVGENELGQKFFRTLFNIDDNNNVTGYIDERVLAQTYQMLRDKGAFNKSGESIDYDYTQWTDLTISDRESLSKYPKPLFNGNTLVYEDATYYYEITSDNIVTYYRNANLTTTVLLFDTSYKQVRTDKKTGATVTTYPTGTKPSGASYRQQFINISPNNIIASPGINYFKDTADISPSSRLTWIILTRGDKTIFPSLDGITDIEDATQYPPTNITGTTLDDVLQQLKQTYPDLFNDSITETVIQPDGTTQTVNYVPVPWQITNPTDVAQTSPVTQTNPTTQTIIDPQIAPQIIVQTQTQPYDDTTTPPSPTTPDTGTGNTDPVIMPTGQASALWAIYNPTQAELNAFGGWLWSSDFVEQLKKLFNDPMQAIIGVHKVFATPSTGGSRTIVCGYLDSGVSSKIVTSQYTNVDCGSVDMREYFGNVFDYSPFTSVKIYLPFIGIVPLDVSYIMRSTISVKYVVDVLTGACLANVEVNRDGAGGVIFSYGGSAIVSYPISSGSYVGVVSGAISVLAGVAGAIASGGSALPVVAGVASGIGKAHTDIQHSGQFSGSAGAMGSKKPYLIISRPQTRIANNIAEYSGIPSNATVKLSSCNGYTKVSEVHLSISNAFDSELAEIERLLKGGVII